VRELLLALGVIRRWPTEDDEAVGFLREGILLLLGVIIQGVGLLLPVALFGAPRQELLHEPAVLIGVLDGVGVVQARSLEHLLEVIWGTLGRHLLALARSSGHERVTGSWLVLLLL
jgi:hypothetical protein